MYAYAVFDSLYRLSLKESIRGVVSGFFHLLQKQSTAVPGAQAPAGQGSVADVSEAVDDGPGTEASAAAGPGAAPAAEPRAPDDLMALGDAWKEEDKAVFDSQLLVQLEKLDKDDLETIDKYAKAQSKGTSWANAHKGLKKDAVRESVRTVLQRIITHGLPGFTGRKNKQEKPTVPLRNILQISGSHSRVKF